ncbi:hypothetical protein L9F63_005868 [Diploptera punctata]|uniref:Leucine-rich repeat-containing protein 23 n=1 Tax=Diploptera punctata TaxID=6984 RepID=A0AAD8E4Z9_DIPPU|nr:hypothetical protein L9F63_005868 [Diploptera punctata]
MAAKCLTMLGKTGNAIEYAYLKIEATNMDLNDISVITSFKYVEFVDVSGNHLSTENLHCLTRLRNLLMLKADGNIITSLDLPPMSFLQVLILSNNEIRNTAGLKEPILESLNLNYNLITQVEDMEPDQFQHLRHLELRGNALTATSGISFVNLHSLYLADNLISRLEGLDVLENLLRLHLRDNRLVKLNGFSNNMKHLKYLNVRNNLIEDMMEVKKLNVLPALETLVLLENTFTRETEEDYRVEVLVHLPKLRRIDKDPVQQDEIEEAEERRAEREEIAGEEGEEEEEEKEQSDSENDD